MLLDMSKKTDPTSRPIDVIIPKVLRNITGSFKEGGAVILGAWSEIVGEKLAPMTKAVKFERGVLSVKVKNATLHSLLKEHEKWRLLREYRQRFPSLTVKDIVFQIG